LDGHEGRHGRGQGSPDPAEIGRHLLCMENIDELYISEHSFADFGLAI
jgi:hypothetical protein